MSVLFSINEIAKSYGDDTLFTDLSFDFKVGEKLGLIGSNGSGKSTLLKIVAGLTLPDEGTVEIAKGEKIVYLAQEDQLDTDLTVEQILHQCLEKEIMDERERHRRVNRSLGKGGFPDANALVKTLSGGWRKRLAITRALCMNPDLLLLDEPTNHLDIGGILWLERILSSAAFSFVLVSHDRAFLENTCSQTMEMAKYYPAGYFKIQGTYPDFEQERDKFLDAQTKQQASLASKMRREEEWLRQGPKARSTKAKFRLDQAEKLRSVLAAVKERNRHTARVDIDFTATGRQTRKLLRVHNLEKGFKAARLFSKVTFELGPGFCLGVVGENGSGKSTFLSLLEKKSEPDQGTVKWAEGLKIAVFDQNRTRLDPEITLREALNPAGGDSVLFQERSIHVVTWAKRFLFMPDQLDMPVKDYQAVKKARIVLANLMQHPADILLLDEPTNDLDILSLEVLEQSIKEFAGAVVIVSHDRYLMDRVCHRMLFLNPDTETVFYKDFNQILSARSRLITERDKKTQPPREKPKKETPKPKMAFSYKDKYELEHIEDKILSAEETVADLTDKIQDPEVIRDTEQMTACCLELEKAERTVNELYGRWEILEQKKLASES